MNLTEVVLDNGQRIRLATITGTVIGATGDRATSGRHSPPLTLTKDFVVAARTDEAGAGPQGFWLVDDQGSERYVQLSGFALAAREGHRVSVLFGAPAWRREGASFGALNHSSGDMVCDITVLGTALRSWGIKVGAMSSLLRWTVSFAGILGGIAFVMTRGPLDNQAAMALGGLCAGAVAGVLAWTFVGSGLGPDARARQLALQINDAGAAALRATT